jgi:hypothetical protein
MSEPPPSHGLSLPYLIDALAQLEEAITCRAGELGDAEQQLACEARGEGKPADYYADTPSRWPREREECYL